MPPQQAKKLFEDMRAAADRRAQETPLPREAEAEPKEKVERPKQTTAPKKTGFAPMKRGNWMSESTGKIEAKEEGQRAGRVDELQRKHRM